MPPCCSWAIFSRTRPLRHSATAIPISWAETGERLLALVDGAVVPGHGDPFDRAFAERQVASLRTVAELCRDTMAGRIGIDEADPRVAVSAEPTSEALERARLELSE